MPRRSTRRRLTRRRYLGEQHAEPLVDVLNRAAGKRATRKIEHTLTAGKRGGLKIERILRNFQALTASATWEDISKELGLPMPFTMATPRVQTKKWNAAYEELRNTLRRFKFYPELLTPKEGVWRFYWRSVRHYHVESLVYQVLRLAELGMILRVRECVECTQWFYARFAHQLFCKGKCKEKHSRTSKKHRARRRDYMRSYMRKYRG